MDGTIRQKLKYVNEKTGWLQLKRLLDEASKDPHICAATQASKFVEYMRMVASDAFRARSLLEVEGFIDKEVVSNHARKIANKGHSSDLPIIAWIREEWEKNGGKDSKRAFAKKYVPLIQKRFGVSRKERTISGSWLKGC